MTEKQEFWETTRFQIGEPWPWEPEWVAERGFKWLPDSGVLLLVEEGVTEEMCQSLMGNIDLALIATGPLVGLLVRFGDAWGWAEVMGWRTPDQGVPERLVDDGSPHPHAVFSIVLVDVSSKEIKHMRMFTTSPHFSKALYREVKDRWTVGTNAVEAQVAFDEYARKYPTEKTALKSALARCHAGD